MTRKNLLQTQKIKLGHEDQPSRYFAGGAASHLEIGFFPSSDVRLVSNASLEDIGFKNGPALQYECLNAPGAAESG